MNALKRPMPPEEEEMPPLNAVLAGWHHFFSISLCFPKLLVLLALQRHQLSPPSAQTWKMKAKIIAWVDS